jgi:serralysin
MASVTTVSATGDQDIDGLLQGTKWNTTTLTYSFPTSGSYYGAPYASGETTNNFQALTTTQQAAAQLVFGLYESIINVNFTEVIESSKVHGDLRLAQSNSPTIAYAYYPSWSEVGGDVWLHTDMGSLANPDAGNYAFETLLHEIGHALGLAHGHEGGIYGPMTATHDSMDYSIMT